MLVYYENNIPFLYKRNLKYEEGLLRWLVEQRNAASVEEVTDEMLAEVLEENEFVAVVFLGLCREECKLIFLLENQLSDPLKQNPTTDEP